ncbi:MAG: CDP-glycerol glycerophosphotransferase family protein [Anaerolineae bacterium]|nr:CDP-glycerol glycerophosphotransferase family protein [Anaerolineae bacterium]
MSRPRLLIPISGHFTVRYLVRTGMLAELSSFAQPVILLRWDNVALKLELESLGAEVYPMPRYHDTPDIERLRSRLTFHHFLKSGSSSIIIDRRRKKRVRGRSYALKRTLREWKMRFELARPQPVARLQAEEERLFWAQSNAQEIEATLRQIKPDAFFSITPYTNDEPALSRVAQRLGLKLCTAILSFDNITTRPPLPVIFDRYLLWNAYNKNELLRDYTGIDESQIRIVGAPQFDFYWDDQYVWDEQVWREFYHVPADRPIVFFGAGFYEVAPHEHFILQQLDQAITNREIPHNPIIIFRRHPVDPVGRWQDILAQAQNVIVDTPWTGTSHTGDADISRQEIEKLVSLLKHTHVHINTSSTLTVDGAVFDKPQIGPAYDDVGNRKFDRIMRDLYEREHFLPITYSGGLDLVHSRDQLITAVTSALANPAAGAEGRRKLVEEIITFTDGKATQRVVAALKEFLGPAP